MWINLTVPVVKKIFRLPLNVDLSINDVYGTDSEKLVLQASGKFGLISTPGWLYKP